jgi:hypothetical protein
VHSENNYFDYVYDNSGIRVGDISEILENASFIT